MRYLLPRRDCLLFLYRPVSAFLTILLTIMLAKTGVAQMSIDSGDGAGFAQSGDYRIYYHEYGQGAPLILVHGWGADSHSNWVASGWVALLAEQRRVVTIDVRGHGRSDKPHALAPYSYAAMSDDVLAVMDVLNIPQADFMGYSMGAFMGAYLLGHHPHRFRTMVLGGIGDETTESAAQGQAIADALRAVDISADDNSYAAQVRRFVSANPHNDLQALAWSAQKMWPEGYPLQIAGPHAGQVKLPVLIVNGANDYPYVNSADHLAASLGNARHVRIADRDHLSVVADKRFQ